MLKKRGVFLLFILILIPVAYAQGYSQNNYLIIDTNLDASIDMNYQTTNAKLESLEAELHFYPRPYPNQEIISFNTFSEPQANIRENNNINYKWNIKENSFAYGFNSRVKVKNSISKIDKELKFPITGLREEDLIFTEETGYIDVTPQIKDKANEIVSGEEDLFNAIVKLAEWTRLNIKYNLNTLTDGVVQKSSWVLASKEGVCDEITNLFVSYLRSLNIPVKYISGIAYSNSINNFGPHAWAEVYFPGYGYIPFDVTFGQYGWIDPSHVKMSEGKDAKEPSVVYNWKAVNVDISNKKFDVTASLITTGENINPLIELEVIPIKNNIASDGYAPIEVKVKNLQNSYLSTLVFFTIAPEIINKNEKAILLAPLQQKSLYWILKVDEINDNNKYTSLLEAQDSFGAKANSNLNFAKDGEFLTQKEAEKIINNLQEIEEIKYKYDLIIDCSSDKSSYYKYETAIINCDLKNTGNVPLNFDLCLDKNCEKVDLKIAEEKTNNFTLTLENTKTLNIKAKNENIDLISTINLKVFSEPEIEIISLNYDNIKYNERGNYELILSASPEIYDLKIKITGSKNFNLKKFLGKQRLSLPFKAWKVGAGEKEIKLIITYKDKNGRIYGLEKNYKIEIENIPFIDKFLVNFKDLMMLV